jgi:FKBP-type peptidyl-prolyl cis-trans isomerase
MIFFLIKCVIFVFYKNHNLNKMKITKLILLLIVFGASAILNAQTSNPLKTEKDSLGYAVGIMNAEQMQQYHVFDIISAEGFSQAIKDFQSGKLALTQEENAKLMEKFQNKIGEIQKAEQAKQQAENAKIAEENKAIGKKFLAENGKRKGVITTASGLQFENIQEGTGKNPNPTDKVTVHYTGTLIDGTKFDSSVDRGEPAVFGLNQVIPGWTEGLQLIKEGGKAKLYIPSEIAYGDNPRAGGPIKPGQTLIFEVELIKIDATPGATGK